MDTKTMDTNILNISERILALKSAVLPKEIEQLDTHSSPQSEQVLQNWREELIDLFAYSFTNIDTENKSDVENWGEETLNLLIKIDFSLDKAIKVIRYYRIIVGEIIKNEAEKLELSLSDYHDLIFKFTSIIDFAIHWLSITYTRFYTNRINAAETSVLELSIPVIKILDGIGILPLIGDIDTKRAQELMEQALLKGASLSLEYLLIDLSGVPIIDTMVADRIFKVVDSLKLIGIKPILTGIRPEIAQTMVQLGINFSSILTYSNFQDALVNIRKF
ncbi:STAS domain-containing protein [Cytobacillus oceanisediminis]|uniref:STAS domain-containing protein n=1 Tax=Cytobacillus oceanisediminis TaxID=665099 RepID=UPI001C23EC9D|nr:STAS domain-containing protein [Cytobacillus oceanisediminis]MBU8768686.1 STAS domain-containing protein [Cytobacillus oceanisediminis]